MQRHRLKRVTAPAFLLLCSVVACSDNPPWAGSVEIADSVEVVLNPGEPLLRGAEGLASRLWEAQGPDWVDPTHVHVRSGLVTVADPKGSQVHVVSTAGTLEASLGRPGGGPGEFLQLLDAFRVGDSLVVLDPGKGSAEYLDLEGRYLSALHLGGQAWDGFPLQDGTLLVKGEFLSDPTEGTLGDWVRIGEDGEPSAFTSRPLDLLLEEQGVQCSDLSSWADGAARLRFTTPQIQIFDQTGRLLRDVRIDIPVQAVSSVERDSALSDLRRRLAARGLPPPFIEQSVVVMGQRWRVKCRFGPLRFDPSRRYAAFLEQNPDEFGAGPATLHFLSEDGVYLARATFPTAWRAFAMEDGVVYALTRDPTTDVVSLEAFGIDLPPELFGDATRALDEARRRVAPT